MKLESRLARLEADRGDKPNPKADAAFARLADYLDTGGPEVVVTIARLVADHPRKGAAK